MGRFRRASAAPASAIAAANISRAAIGEQLHAAAHLYLPVRTAPAKEDASKYQRPDHDLDTIGDLFAELRSCWSPPPADQAHQGMQMSVRFSFKKSGELIGPPQLTFATAGAPTDARSTY